MNRDIDDLLSKRPRLSYKNQGSSSSPRDPRVWENFPQEFYRRDDLHLNSYNAVYNAGPGFDPPFSSIREQNPFQFHIPNQLRGQVDPRQRHWNQARQRGSSVQSQSHQPKQHYLPPQTTQQHLETLPPQQPHQLQQPQQVQPPHQQQPQQPHQEQKQSQPKQTWETYKRKLIERHSEQGSKINQDGLLDHADTMKKGGHPESELQEVKRQLDAEKIKNMQLQSALKEVRKTIKDQRAGYFTDPNSNSHELEANGETQTKSNSQTLAVDHSYAKTSQEKLELDLAQALAKLAELEHRHQRLNQELVESKANAAVQQKERDILKNDYVKASADRRRLELDLSREKLRSNTLDLHFKELNAEHQKCKTRLQSLSTIHKTQLSKAQEGATLAKAEKEKLEQELSDSKKKNADLNGKHQKLNSDLDKLKARVEEQASEFAKHKAKLRKAHEDSRSAKEAKEKFELDLSKAKKKLSDLRSQHQSLNSELKKNQAQLSEQAQENESIKIQLSKALQDEKFASDAKEKLELEMVETKKSFKDLDWRHQALTSELDKCKADVAKQDKLCERQKKDLTEYLRANFVYKNKNTLYENRISDLEQTNEGQRLTLNNIRDQITDLQKLVGTKEAELSAGESRNALLNADIAAFKAQVENLKLENQMLTRAGIKPDYGKLEEISLEIKAKDDQIEVLSRSHKLLKTKILELEDKNQELERKLKDIEDERNEQLLEFETKRSKLEQEIARKNEELDNLVAKTEAHNINLTSKQKQAKEEYEKKIRALQQSLVLEKAKNKRGGTLVVMESNKPPSQGFESRQKVNSKSTKKEDNDDDDDDDGVIILE